MAHVEIVRRMSVPRVPKARFLTSLRLIRKELSLKPSSHVTVVFVSPATIRQLNRHYRHKDKVTDILSFADPSKESLGDLIICYQQAKKQAEQKKHSMTKELTTLFVHGVLHLLGYDHENDDEAEVMEALEKKIIKKVK